MQTRKNTQMKPNRNRRKRNPRQPRKDPATFRLPDTEAQADGWGSTAEPWPETIDESDVRNEIISVWRENVYAAEYGGELRKMEDVYERLHAEREKWEEQLNNPLTWGWGAGQPDELNDWARDTRGVTGWDTHQPDQRNWTNAPAFNHRQWEVHQQVNSDKTQDDPSGSRNTERTPPSLLELVSSYADKLKADGRQRSYDFVQLPAEAQAEKIREMAYELSPPKKH